MSFNKDYNLKFISIDNVIDKLNVYSQFTFNKEISLGKIKSVKPSKNTMVFEKTTLVKDSFVIPLNIDNKLVGINFPKAVASLYVEKGNVLLDSISDKSNIVNYEYFVLSLKNHIHNLNGSLIPLGHMYFMVEEKPLRDSFTISMMGDKHDFMSEEAYSYHSDFKTGIILSPLVNSHDFDLNFFYNVSGFEKNNFFN